MLMSHSLFAVKGTQCPKTKKKKHGKTLDNSVDYTHENTPSSCLGLFSYLSVELATVKLQGLTNGLAAKGILHHATDNLVLEKSPLNNFPTHT